MKMMMEAIWGISKLHQILTMFHVKHFSVQNWCQFICVLQIEWARKKFTDLFKVSDLMSEVSKPELSKADASQPVLWDTHPVKVSYSMRWKDCKIKGIFPRSFPGGGWEPTSENIICMKKSLVKIIYRKRTPTRPYLCHLSTFLFPSTITLKLIHIAL